MKPIPIIAGKTVAEKYGTDQVVIIARKVGEAGASGEHVTTYGVDKANCDVAAHMGDFFKFKLMGWKPDQTAVNSHATLTAALEEARGALKPFVAKMKKVEDQYRKRGGNPDAFPDTHPSFDISADSRELPLGAWRRARTALATIEAALGRVEG